MNTEFSKLNISDEIKQEDPQTFLSVFEPEEFLKKARKFKNCKISSKFKSLTFVTDFLEHWMTLEFENQDCLPDYIEWVKENMNEIEFIKVEIKKADIKK